MKLEKISLRTRTLVIFLACWNFCHFTSVEANQEEKIQTPASLALKTGQIAFYKVHFNGIKVGKIEFEYKGRNKIDGKFLEIIEVSSDVKILGLFEIESKEMVYFDRDTNLVNRVKRDVKFLGREEVILEEYNQKEGWINITRSKGKITQSSSIQRTPPIHNILILYFLYPFVLEDETIGKAFEFNLPLRKISIRVKESRKMRFQDRIEEVYFLEGSPKRFKIWLKKEERLPLRVEIPAFSGKLVITKR